MLIDRKTTTGLLQKRDMAPFEGPFVFGPLMTLESKVELHRLSILTAIQMGYTSNHGEIFKDL
jgi:hypothetical protein